MCLLSLSLFLCMYVRMYVYHVDAADKPVRIYAHTLVFTYVYILRVGLRCNPDACMSVYVYMFICSYVYVSMHALYVYTRYIFEMCIHTGIHIDTRVY